MLGVQSLSTTTLSQNCCGYNSVQDLKNCTELSALLLKKTTGKIVLYTDVKGAEVVKKFSHLYDDVVISLDSLTWVQSHNWAFSKLHAYNQIKEPFVHIDNDFFLWDGLPTHFFDTNKTDAFFQHVELFDQYPLYQQMISEVKSFLPKIITRSNCKYAYNCGIVGFNDLSIIPAYYDTAKNYVIENQEIVFKNGITKSGQPLLFEQWFITHFCQKKKIDFILNEDTSPKYALRYTHLLSTSKKNVQHMQQVKRKLKMLSLQPIM